MTTRKPATILLTGVNGQVGFELARSLQGLGRVVALDRGRLDLGNLDQVRSVVREVKPTLIVNPAAHTAVDKAESEPDLAMRLNAEAPAVLAEEARRLDAALVHYSTDYVFDGTKIGAYVEDDAVNPQNVYGKSKLAGEQAIAASGCSHLIFRTSWVYGTRGKNFLLTMLRLGAERDELSVVADQIGAPTWSNTIATLTSNVLSQSVVGDPDDWWKRNSGVYHLTASGVTSWHGFAQAIFDNSTLAKKPTVKPIPAASYPTPAARPANSRMSNDKLYATFGVKAPEWEDALRLSLDSLARS
ncbi:dTDP-4-dehydrorhamnose reductase [Paraburkholderia terricola]|uniref:dTDP-4-dehydrorhamnose reductase n=1 Tax=Paraburkholderia terricola TaxID=169427 RepID=A0ABU1LM11_9BURK|nr:dTDP-4-dehydrorhamnose reductase [Paraburkholderia terricola]MDR6407576.1 dTDP-4-dehydrorhamnose reductase [Paraburkholderia terricola]MDR6480208.1 dTDP-4-dehydrorhamnose reductase [Paraburkholderia terricola]